MYQYNLQYWAKLRQQQREKLFDSVPVETEHHGAVSEIHASREYEIMCKIIGKTFSLSNSNQPQPV